MAAPFLVPAPFDEERRLATMQAHALLDSEPEAEFDALVSLAADMLGCPVAALTLADRTRVILACGGVQVAFNPELRQRIVEFLGEGNFKVQTADFKPTQQPPRGRGNGYQRQAANA